MLWRRIASLDDRAAARRSQFWISCDNASLAAVSAAFCARSGASAERFCWVLAWAWAARVRESAARRCSFSGFGGMGGAGCADEGWVGSEMSKGSERRSMAGAFWTGGAAAAWGWKPEGW